VTANVSGWWALVTGASSGLGVDFAKELAQRGANLVLVARRQDRLEQVRAEIEAAHSVEVKIVVADLAAPDAADALYDQIKAMGIEIDVLVNNAGLGLYGTFVEIEWAREKSMLELDIITLTHLTKLFVRDMVRRGRGYILQVASIGAYQPSPLYATYAAAKSYVLNFSLALDYELRGTGVRVAVVCPGVVRTEFHQVSGQDPTLYTRLAMMDSPTVARIAIRGLLNGRSQIVPGLLNTLTALSTRLVPRRVAAAFAYVFMR
jgi:uncharacterized protein